MARNGAGARAKRMKKVEPNRKWLISAPKHYLINPQNLVLDSMFIRFPNAKELPQYCKPDLRWRKNFFQKALPCRGPSGLLRNLLRFYFCPKHKKWRKYMKNFKKLQKKFANTNLLALLRRLSFDATNCNASALLSASRFWQICI